MTANNKLINEEMLHDTIDKCFTDAVIEVIRTSTGIEVYEEKDNIELNMPQSERVSGLMILCGQNNALLSITMSYDTASTIISYMTGILPEEIEEKELWDGAAELANMVAGRAKVELAGTEYHFNITPPFSIAGKDYYLMHKSSTNRVYKKLVSGDIKIALKVTYI